jgi:hypothetical protein
VWNPGAEGHYGDIMVRAWDWSTAMQRIQLAIHHRQPCLQHLYPYGLACLLSSSERKKSTFSVRTKFSRESQSLRGQYNLSICLLNSGSYTSTWKEPLHFLVSVQQPYSGFSGKVLLELLSTPTS